MDKLQEYLENEYLKETEQRKEVEALIKGVLLVFTKYESKTGWIYEIREDAEHRTGRDSFSSSTTAMVAFSMAVLFGDFLDIVIDKGEGSFGIGKTEKYEIILDKAVKELLSNFKENNKKSADSFDSSTYGADDPFTFVWVMHLIDRYYPDEHYTDDEKKTISIISMKSITLVSDVFSSINKNNEIKYSNKNKKEISPIEPNHMFPLLKVVQLYRMFKETRTSPNKHVIQLTDEESKIFDGIDPKTINSVRTFLNNRLHYYLSLSKIENSNFDAAELVFSLEALLLLDDNIDNFDEALVKRVFHVLNERQDISIYWRPLTPFVTNSQGFALLPLSVEIAMSLIRICRWLKNGEEIFSDNIQIFNNYTNWVKTRVSVVQADKTKYYGWCSEHISKPNLIHVWETSQVLIYLANFNDMLQRHIANKSLKLSNLTCDKPKSEDKFGKWLEQEPVQGNNIYVDIYNGFVIGSKKSMLLYGPPGTGKTTIAENIARDRVWSYITITPSDFIANGPDMVEAKAKNIFTVLCEQSEKVIMFDEIDRLILDRDAKAYTDQSDTFQFMTPSMLVKIKDLHDTGKVIFAIGTNYAERIDPAIKRAGRIDEQFLVLPPDAKRRETIITEHANAEKYNDVLQQAGEHWKEELIRRTALYTYGEIKQALDFVVTGMKKNKGDAKVCFDNLLIILHPPTVSLINYGDKIGVNAENTGPEAKTPNYAQKAEKDFLYLAYLKIYNAENVHEFDFNAKEKKLFVTYLKGAVKDCVDSKEYGKKLYNLFGDDNIIRIFVEACDNMFKEPEVDHVTQEDLKNVFEMLKLIYAK